MCCTLLAYDLWRLEFYRLNHKQHFSQSVFFEWPHWDNDRGWSGAEELLRCSIFHWAAVDDGVMGGRWRWAEGEVFKGWRCFALNCTAAGCNRRQLEGAEWSSSRWAQPAAPVWQMHRRSNWGPHWLLFWFQLLFVWVLTSLFARIWWRWHRKVSANDWKCVWAVCVMYGCVRAVYRAGGRIYFNTGLFCVWCQNFLCHTWEGRDHHRSSRWVSSLSLSPYTCVRIIETAQRVVLFSLQCS